MVCFRAAPAKGPWPQASGQWSALNRHSKTACPICECRAPAGGAGDGPISRCRNRARAILMPRTLRRILSPAEADRLAGALRSCGGEPETVIRRVQRP